MHFLIRERYTAGRKTSLLALRHLVESFSEGRRPSLECPRGKDKWPKSTSNKRLSELYSSHFFSPQSHVACRPANEEFFGRTVPPERNILRYVNGAEPESIDPAISSGQQEARIYMALYEGLVEYDPKSLDAIPAIAERWDVNNDSSEFVFHLRRNARWSNGEPINAHDFVYSIRRSLAPEVQSRSADLAYPIRYAEAFNAGAVFVRDPANNQFLLEKDFADGEPSPRSAEPETALGSE